MVKDSSTEYRIIEAARRVFMRKGMTGARMQEIADEAGINKALLHYYFRSKDKLYNHILTEVMDRISQGIATMFEQEMTVKERLLTFVDVYIDVLKENTYLPLFILNEINHNPDRFALLVREKITDKLGIYIQQMLKEVQEGMIRPIHPLHLILNILGMIIFPFAIHPVLDKVFGEEMKGILESFFEERKVVVKEFIENAITPK